MPRARSESSPQFAARDEKHLTTDIHINLLTVPRCAQAQKRGLLDFIPLRHAHINFLRAKVLVLAQIARETPVRAARRGSFHYPKFITGAGARVCPNVGGFCFIHKISPSNVTGICPTFKFNVIEFASGAISF